LPQTALWAGRQENLEEMLNLGPFIFFDACASYLHGSRPDHRHLIKIFSAAPYAVSDWPSEDSLAKQ
jgi:hypothetical protein